MSLYNFPHSSNYDQDLGFLIRKYKELDENYLTLLEIYEIVKKNIKDITLEQLKEWLDNGTFASLINSYIFNGMPFNVLYPPNGFEPLIRNDTSEATREFNSRQLNKIINYLGTLETNNRGVIYFPKGNYFFSQPITINYKQIHLIGEGCALTNLLYTKPTGTFITVNGSSDNVLNYFKMSDMGISYTFIASSEFTSEGTVTNHLLDINYCQYSNLENLVFYYAYILVNLNNAYGTRFINSQLMGSDKTVYGCNVINRVDSSVFTNVKATNLQRLNDSIAFRIVGTSSPKDLQLISCETNGWRIGIQVDGALTNFPIDIMLKDTICDKFYYRAIRVSNMKGNKDIACLTIDGGWFQPNETLTTQDASASIELVECHGVIITNCQFSIYRNYNSITPLRIINCRNILVNNNVFQNGYRLCYINKGRFINITNNSFRSMDENNNQPACLFVDTLYSNFTSNLIDGYFSYWVMSLNASNLLVVSLNNTNKTSIPQGYQLVGTSNVIENNITA